MCVIILLATRHQRYTYRYIRNVYIIIGQVPRYTMIMYERVCVLLFLSILLFSNAYTCICVDMYIYIYFFFHTIYIFFSLSFATCILFCNKSLSKCIQSLRPSYCRHNCYIENSRDSAVYL